MAKAPDAQPCTTFLFESHDRAAAVAKRLRDQEDVEVAVIGNVLVVGDTGFSIETIVMAIDEELGDDDSATSDDDA